MSARGLKYLAGLAAAAFAFWITREHNRLAGTASEQMVRGGFSALGDTLKTVTVDFAVWKDAVEVRRGGVALAS